MDPEDPDYGGFVHPSSRFVDGRQSILKGQELCALYLTPGVDLPWSRSRLARHVGAHLAFLRTCAYEDGSIDHLGSGIGTGPEAGFVLPFLCETFRRFSASDLPEQREALDTLEPFILRSADVVRREPALTSNHRWAACAGPLSVVQGLFPNPKNASVIDDYLADGIDLNDDGLYYEERSPNYDTVANWGLILLADHYRRPDLLKLVERNLRFALKMRQPNGEAETLFSLRQDRGKAGASFGNYYIMRRIANESGDGVLAQGADQLLEEMEKSDDRDRIITSYHLLSVARRADELTIARKPLPNNYVEWFNTSAMWRARSMGAAATVAADPGGHYFDTILGGWGGAKRSDAVMSYHFHDAVIASVKLLWGAGIGGLRPQRIEQLGDNEVRLSFDDPGWDHIAHFRREERREPRRLPVNLRGSIDVAWQACGEVALRIRVEGWERVPVNLQLLLREQGELVPADKGPLALERGGRTYSDGGTYTLRSPAGARVEVLGLPQSKHQLNLGKSPPIPGKAERRAHRLIAGLLTPVDFRVVLRPVRPVDT